jgi:catechol 2,3-dioxygenase-like lactoylglutathione lyase family enzyme
MLHHVSLPVADLKRSIALYDAALAALGYRQVCSGRGFAGYGIEAGKDKFAIKHSVPSASAGPRFHLAFVATSRDAVDAFHEAAILHGASSDGAPGLRAHYGPSYYAAFIIDLDGHRIEAVHNTPTVGAVSSWAPQS